MKTLHPTAAGRVVALIAFTVGLGLFVSTSPLGVSSLANANEPAGQARHAGNETKATVSGKQIYARCAACHSLDRNRTGPKHCGLFGRKAGTAKGFRYSNAMAASSTIWSKKTLMWFLEAPMERIPGTTMGFAGIKDAQEREALVDYLQQASLPTSEDCR